VISLIWTRCCWIARVLWRNPEPLVATAGGLVGLTGCDCLIEHAAILRTSERLELLDHVLVFLTFHGKHPRTLKGRQLHSQ
jgi:hypothetical protein